MKEQQAEQQKHRLALEQKLTKQQVQFSKVENFVQNTLCFTECKGDFVERSKLYQWYKTMYPEEAITKTAMGKRVWFAQLQTLLGANGFHERRKIAASHHRDVWLGWAMK